MAVSCYRYGRKIKWNYRDEIHAGDSRWFFLSILEHTNSMCRFPSSMNSHLPDLHLAQSIYMIIAHTQTHTSFFIKANMPKSSKKIVRLICVNSCIPFISKSKLKYIFMSQSFSCINRRCSFFHISVCVLDKCLRQNQMENEFSERKVNDDLQHWMKNSMNKIVLESRSRNIIATYRATSK